MLQSIVGLIVSLLLAYGAAFLGAIVSPGMASPEWYHQLRKPEWNPPMWLFGPVWIGLYTLMAISAWIIWHENGFTAVKMPLILYMIQLGINAAWSWIFFKWHQLGWAIVEIMVLWVFILWTILAFAKFSIAAAWLMIPYLLWVSFAMVLNASIWRRNRV